MPTYAYEDPRTGGYLWGYLLTYGAPFAAYYVGILVRHYASFLRHAGSAPLGEQLIAGIVFSVVAVAPLLPAIILTVEARDGFDVVAYILIIAVILQEGLVLHERAVTLVANLVTNANQPNATGNKVSSPRRDPAPAAPRT